MKDYDGTDYPDDMVEPGAGLAGIPDGFRRLWTPHRIAYVDVLNHLSHASGVLVLGSTEKHYTPSKVFQAALARHPILALLHRDSTAVDMIRRGKTGTVLTLTEEVLPGTDEVAAALERFVTANGYTADGVDWSVFEETSARQSARLLADAMDRATGG